MNLVPTKTNDTGNYFCTWDSQCDEMYKRFPNDSYLPARDAMNEDFLFGEMGLLKSFDGAREDLIALLDDGWDVPYGARDSHLFGLMEADKERFPSLADLSPADRLKELANRVRELGYKGLGLWVPTQVPTVINGKKVEYTPEEERAFWEERAKWCNYAGVLYIKADWGDHQGDAEYCKMMTECFRKYAPDTKIEHGLVGRSLFEEPQKGYEASEKTKKYLREVLPHCDYLRTYDVAHEVKYASTVDRAAICFEAAREIEGECAILNIEDTALIGAALGCSIGVMRHDFEKIRKYIPLPPRPVSESICALRWQRIAPPFAANIGETHISQKRQKDVWNCPERADNLWPNVPKGNHYVTAPLAISRNMPLPEFLYENVKLPYVLCSIHPDNNALCIAVTPRTFEKKIDVTPPATIKVKGKDPDAPIGLFGSFYSLTIEYPTSVDDKRVYAQNLLSDEAVDITSEIFLSGVGVHIPGKIMTELMPHGSPEGEIPAIVIQLK